MKRYQIYLKEKQYKELSKLSEDKEEPVARLIRDAVDLYLKTQL